MMLGFYRNNDPGAKDIGTEAAQEIVESGACCLLSSESPILDVHKGNLQFVGPPNGCEDVQGYGQFLAKRREIHEWLGSPIRNCLEADDVRQAIRERLELLVTVGTQDCGLSELKARDLLDSLLYA